MLKIPCGFRNSLLAPWVACVGLSRPFILPATQAVCDYFFRAMGDFGKVKKQCPQEMPGDLDLVYIDYIGLRELTTKIGQLLPQFK